jgi:hypothetical protein
MSNEPKTESRYATLMELNSDEHESWYTFIKVQGNEQAIKKLRDQLESIEWDIDEGSTFDLDSDNPVSATTAKEMTKLDLNPTMFHRKFDGKLKEIDFKFETGNSHVKRMKKVRKLLEGGGIENFIDDEDIDPEDRIDEADMVSESDSESSESSESVVETRRKYKKKLGKN